MGDEREGRRKETTRGKNKIVKERESLERHHDRKPLNEGISGPMAERWKVRGQKVCMHQHHHQPIMAQYGSRGFHGYLLLVVDQQPIAFVLQISVSTPALRGANSSKPGFLFGQTHTGAHFSLTLGARMSPACVFMWVCDTQNNSMWGMNGGIFITRTI